MWQTKIREIIKTTIGITETIITTKIMITEKMITTTKFNNQDIH